jgi:hypothetical protein
MPLKYPWLTLPRGRSKTSARYASLCRDDAVKSAFAILLKCSHSCRSEHPHETRKVPGTRTSERAPPRSVVAAPQVRQGTREYRQITIAAPPRGVGNWYNRSAGRQVSVFIPGGHLETGRASAAWREPCEGHT